MLAAWICVVLVWIYARNIVRESIYWFDMDEDHWRRIGETNILIIFISGRVHYVLMTFCACEPQCITLLRWGFWASSPEKPSVGYSLELMKMLQAMTLECQAAASSFVQMLRWKNELSESEVSTANAVPKRFKIWN